MSFLRRTRNGRSVTSVQGRPARAALDRAIEHEIIDEVDETLAPNPEDLPEAPPSSAQAGQSGVRGSVQDPRDI